MLGWAQPAHAHSAVLSTETFSIRGHTQTLHVYGSRDGDPVILSSGDGGWIHLAPHVAELLAQFGYRVVGFDARAYLASFTSHTGTLKSDDVIGDYGTLIQYATQNGRRAPLLIGVSEGAGLSVLAGTGRQNKPLVDGVIGVGLGNMNELGWRWTDATIYLTHGLPHEPLFSILSLIDRLAPLPLALIHSLHDEYAPATDAERIVRAAPGPARLWSINASNHRFSGNTAEFDRRLIEAIEWVHQQQALTLHR
jgi:pimeloyl-ACP methyl ester carboxylesterase